MKGLTLFVFAIQLLPAQTQPALPPAIQNSFRFSSPGTGPINVFAAGFDAMGNLYLAGGGGGAWPSTTTFLSPSPAQADMYVMKISGPATSTPQVAYVTAITQGVLYGMVVDPSGNVYLAGYTFEANFPTTSGSYQTSSANGGGFLLKLDPSGKKLVYSTFFNYPETVIHALAVDANGNAYIGGQTSTATFPTTPGAFQTTPPPSQFPPGFSIAFVSEFDATGANLLYSTFLGGSSSNVVTEVNQLAVDSAGSIRIIGEFGATGGSATFPFTANAPYTSGPGFFTILSKTSPYLLYSTALPPSGLSSALMVDNGNSNGTIAYYIAPGTESPLVVFSDGTAVVAGSTEAPSFPTRNTLMPCVPNLPQPSASATFSGSLYGSATLTTLDPSGNTTFSTLLSAPGGNTQIGALALDQNGALWIIGSVVNNPRTAYITGPPGSAQFPAGPIIDSSTGTNFAFKLDFSAVPQGVPAPSCMASAGNGDAPYNPFNLAPAAPAEIATLFGSNLGPTIGVQYQLNANGVIPAQLDGTTLTVGGVPAPILYAQDTQINFIVPRNISGPTTDVCVTRSGAQSCISAFTAQQWPAIFCVSACETGPLAVLNQDGTLNSSSNPASSGSVLVIFGTGMGPYDRTLSDGAIVQLPLANLAHPVSAIFYGPYPPCDPGPCTGPTPFPATVLFAGAAPLEVAGVDQVNVLIPQSAVTGHAITLTLEVGNSTVGTSVYLK